MNIKEKLECILKEPGIENAKGTFITIREIEQIIQGLDKLEKLERMFEILQRHLYVCSGFIEGRITTEKNFRECLSNSWSKYYNGMLVTDNDYYELYDLWNELIKEKK